MFQKRFRVTRRKAKTEKERFCKEGACGWSWRRIVAPVVAPAHTAHIVGFCRLRRARGNRRAAISICIVECNRCGGRGARVAAGPVFFYSKLRWLVSHLFLLLQRSRECRCVFLPAQRPPSERKHFFFPLSHPFNNRRSNAWWWEVGVAWRVAARRRFRFLRPLQMEPWEKRAC